MCGRYTLKTPKKIIEQIFDRPLSLDYQPRYNIAPTQQVLALRTDEEGTSDWEYFRWGLIPHWSKDKSIAHKLINARSETVRQKYSFRDAVKKRRCLVVADGFFEWKAVSGGGKQPFYFKLRTGIPFAFAGLWEYWIDIETGDEIRSCNILTRVADVTVSEVHHRMPVILQPVAYPYWLSPDTPMETVEKLWSKAALPDELDVIRVNRAVNSVANDSEECILPIEEKNGNLV